MKKGIFIVLVLLSTIGFNANAYDFAAGMSNGDTLFFEVTDEVAHSVMVVPPVKNGPFYYYMHTQPSGTLIIPDQVKHNGQSYQVTSIGDRAFSGCTKLQMVVLPEHLREIGAYAFYGCTGLKNRMSIGTDVVRIGASAFYGCTGLSEVNFRARNCEYMGGSVSMTVFGNCRSLHKIVIDDGVQRIPDYAFCGISSVNDSLKFPLSLHIIGNYAFAYCSNLSGNVNIPDSVVSIGDCAFHQCHSIKTVTIGEKVNTIGNRAFYHCIGLKTIRLTSLNPPQITVSSFADIPRTTRFSVPCVSKILYEKSTSWKRQGNFDTHGPCTFSITASMDNPQAGIVSGIGDYSYGDSVSLMAVCAAGFGFDGWTDGNTENPRRFMSTENAVFTAITRPSGTLVIRDSIFRIDTVFAEGYKVVHDTVDLIDIAQSVNGLEEVEYDANSKRLKWDFPRKEKVISVSLYNQSGVCVYTDDGRKGSVSMKRFMTGSYFVRIETLYRVIRCRFFMNSENGWREMIAQ